MSWYGNDTEVSKYIDYQLILQVQLMIIKIYCRNVYTTKMIFEFVLFSCWIF